MNINRFVSDGWNKFWGINKMSENDKLYLDNNGAVFFPLYSPLYSNEELPKRFTIKVEEKDIKAAENLTKRLQIIASNYLDSPSSFKFYYAVGSYAESLASPFVAFEIAQIIFGINTPKDILKTYLASVGIWFVCEKIIIQKVVLPKILPILVAQEKNKEICQANSNRIS